MNKRALATAYGIVALVLLIVINLGLILPEKMQIAQYHVTELIPMPSLRPEPEPIKVVKPEIHPKLLPAVKLPVFHAARIQDVATARHAIERDRLRDIAGIAVHDETVGAILGTETRVDDLIDDLIA